MSSEWNQADEQTLRDLHASGLSFGKMAAAMNRTRNQVAGKCQRLGLVCTDAYERRAAFNRARVHAPKAKPKPPTKTGGWQSGSRVIRRAPLTKSALYAMLEQAALATAALPVAA